MISLDNWNVVAKLGDGVYVTNGNVLYQIGGHTEETDSPKALKRDYARLYQEHK